MKKNFVQLLSLLMVFALVVFVYSCRTGHQKDTKNNNTDSKGHQTIMVFAGASLTDVLSELIDSFEVKYQVKVQTNMASSGTLARQIEQGGTPDVYISASKKWADYVDSVGYLLPGTKSTIAQNELVLIAPLNSMAEVAKIDSTLDFKHLLGKERLSMGDPAHVPAGKYARQSLEYFGWYSLLQGKILPAKDVRSALMVVEMEEAPLGIVYRTDALKSAKVKILNTFPIYSHKPIVYVGGVCKDNSTAKAFFDYINSEATKAIWIKYGFEK
jgi:molybdate transport system substrate-binding protein